MFFLSPGSSRPGRFSGNRCTRTCSLPLLPREVSAGFFQERGLRPKILILPLQLLQPGPFGDRQLLLAAAVGLAILSQSVAEGLGTDAISVSDFLDRLRSGYHLPTQLVLELLAEPSS